MEDLPQNEIKAEYPQKQTESSKQKGSSFFFGLFSDLKKKLFAIWRTSFTIAVLVGVLWCFFSYYAGAPKNFPVNKVITIERGSSLKQVAREFEEQKLVRSAFWFETIGWVMKIEKQVKAGEYFFERKLDAIALMREIIGHGGKNNLVKVVIPEGYTLRDMAVLFEKMGMWNKDDFWEITGSPAVDCRIDVCIDKKNEVIAQSALASAVKPDYVSMEGFLFPDTFYVPVDITPEAMVEIMLDNFEKKMTPELRDAVKKTGHSFFEVLTMASLLEKEASSEDDKRLIAGILWKRLEQGMPLQVDAVFPYIIGKNSFDLTKNDLKTDSSYNTYLNTGLPLGPVANPGLESIKAAIYPTESPFLYYLSDRKGKLYYSINYDEHLTKQAKYLK